MTAYELLDAIAAKEKELASRGYEDWLCDNQTLYAGRSIYQVHDEKAKFYSAEMEVYNRIQYYFDYIKVGQKLNDLQYLTALHEAYSAYDAKFGTNFVDVYFDGKTPDDVAEMWRIQEEIEKDAEERQEFIDKWAMPMLMNDMGLSEEESEAFLYDLGF